MANVTFKKSPALLGFAAVLVIAVAALVVHGDVTWKEAGAFLAGALALPGLFGSRPAPEDEDDQDPPAAGGASPLIIGGMMALLVGCSSPSPATPEQMQARREHEADAAYTADMMKCTAKDLYPTLDASARCTADVRRRWNRRPDGGAS